MRLNNRMFEKEITCMLICFSHKWIIKWWMVASQRRTRFFHSSLELSLLERQMDRQACNMYVRAHTQTHTKAQWTDLCKDVLKDKLSADILILLNKIPPSTYLIFSPFQLQGPLYLSYSAIQHEQLSPPLFACFFIFFFSSLPLSPLLPKGPELLLHCNYTEAAGTYLNIY